MNRIGRLKRRLAFALALTVLSAQVLARVEADALTVGLRSQTKSNAPPQGRPSQNGPRSEAKGATRSRENEPAPERVDYDSPDGPIIRIALMTDVTMVTLSCAAGLVLRSSTDFSLFGASSGQTANRASSDFDDGKRVPGGSLRVELSRRSDSGPAAPLETTAGSYRVVVSYLHEPGVARALVDELKKKFFEPITISYDENQNEYAVLIGQCPTRAEATKLAERLRKAGYGGPRIIGDSQAKHAVAGVHAVANGPAAKSPTDHLPPATDHRPPTADHRPPQLVAFAADKVAATSADELIVVPAESISMRNRIKQSAVPSGEDERDVRGKGSQKDVSAQHGTVSQPRGVRVGGRDYRGELHLVLNARGLINVVNVLRLEDYLRGVLVMEIPLGTPREIEALKAQAVAARSYALSHLGRHQDRGYDLADDARDQLYGGLTAERELANLAIDQTRGFVAVYPNEAGRLVPIEALYTANCGGRTENNEEVFGGTARGYLRSVVCVPDRQPLAEREIVTGRSPEPFAGPEGRSSAREVALLSVLGFQLPRRVTNNYLRGAPDLEEVRSWIEQTARFAQREKPASPRGDVTRLAEFAHRVASAIYGEGRASALLGADDVDYLLAGVRIEQLPREARADVAILLRDGILRLNSATLDGYATITRGQAIETLARAVFFKSPADLKSQTSQTSNARPAITGFKIETSAPAEGGRLMLAAQGSPGNTAARSPAPRFMSVNLSGPPSMERTGPAEPRGDGSPGVAAEIATSTIAEQPRSRRATQSNGIEIAENAWLFRNVGGESYAVGRLMLIGGERVTYHLNLSGQADFLEASMSAHGASNDRLATAGRWQERIYVEELQQRLGRARVNVGQLRNFEPVAFSTSGRVSELEVTGDQGHTRLRGRQISSALGLKETLFVVAAENDARGRVAAFVFSGQGWGHGVGMCQHGACALAKGGYTYAAILRKYYTGVKLKEMY